MEEAAAVLAWEMSAYRFSMRLGLAESDSSFSRSVRSWRSVIMSGMRLELLTESSDRGVDVSTRPAGLATVSVLTTTAFFSKNRG